MSTFVACPILAKTNKPRYNKITEYTCSRCKIGCIKETSP